jgi:hypothetical protein
MATAYCCADIYNVQFHLEGMDDKRVALPSIERQEKLPVVLSREEMKQLLKAPTLLVVEV